MPRLKKNRAIDSIRFLAALLVLLGHLRIILFEDYATAPHNLASQLIYATTSLGTQAVLVFFALSGYWVGGGILTKVGVGRLCIGDYASARLTRLWLVLIPALTLTALVDWVGRSTLADSEVYAHPEHYAGVDSDPSYSAMTFLGNMVFVQDIHVLPFGYNHPLWSLAYEFWYYAIFPALVMASRRDTTSKVRIVATAVALACCVIAGTNVLVLFIAWLLGVVAAHFSPIAVDLTRRFRPRTVAVVRLAAAACTLCSMVGCSLAEIPLRFEGAIIGAPAAFLLWTLAADVDWVGLPGGVLNALEYLSRSSYSLYAIHMPLVVLLAAVVVPQREDRWVLIGPALLALVGIAAAFVGLAIGFASVTEGRTSQTRAALRSGWSNRKASVR